MLPAGGVNVGDGARGSQGQVTQSLSWYGEEHTCAVAAL